MEKVHIITWTADGRIGGVYANHGKACRVAEKSNKNRKWIHRSRLLVVLSGRATKWVVQTFDVKG